MLDEVGPVGAAGTPSSMAATAVSRAAMGSIDNKKPRTRAGRLIGYVPVIRCMRDNVFVGAAGRRCASSAKTFETLTMFRG